MESFKLMSLTEFMEKKNSDKVNEAKAGKMPTSVSLKAGENFDEVIGDPSAKNLFLCRFDNHYENPSEATLLIKAKDDGAAYDFMVEWLKAKLESVKELEEDDDLDQHIQDILELPESGHIGGDLTYVIISLGKI